MNNKLFENIYDTYSAMLYGISLSISTTEKEAKVMLINTFIKVRQLNLTEQNYPSICITLIKLLIQTAQEKLNPGHLKTRSRLKLFEKTPMLQQLFCRQISFLKYCEENNLTRIQGLKLIREEFSIIRNSAVAASPAFTNSTQVIA